MVNPLTVALSVFVFVCFVSCNLETQSDTPLYSDVDTTTFNKGDTVYPFSYINPKERGWKVVIEISGDDLDDLSVRVPGRKLSSTKPKVLNQVRKWKFVYNGGDLATVTSSILVYKNGTLVDQQGIVLDKDQVGLQSIKYGWISPANSNQVYETITLMDEKMF